MTLFYYFSRETSTCPSTFSFLFLFPFISSIVYRNIRSRSRERRRRKIFQIKTTDIESGTAKKKRLTRVVTKTWLSRFERIWKKKKCSNWNRTAREFCRALNLYIIYFLFFFSISFFRLMAYTTNSPSHRRVGSGGSKDSLQQQSHIYEEQPYYANERPATRHSVSRDSRRSAGVCDIFYLISNKIRWDCKRNAFLRFSFWFVTLRFLFLASLVLWK